MSGPPIMYWTSAAVMPPPEMNDTGRDADPQVVGRVLRQDVLAHEVHDLELAVVAVGDVDQPDVDRALVGIALLGVGHAADRVAHAVELADVAGDPRDQHLRGLERRALRRLDAHLELRRVVVGQEVLGDHLEQHRQRGHAADHGQRPRSSGAAARTAARPGRPAR